MKILIYVLMIYNEVGYNMSFVRCRIWVGDNGSEGLV
jgi:hypothetical protein